MFFFFWRHFVSNTSCQFVFRLMFVHHEVKLGKKKQKKKLIQLPLPDSNAPNASYTNFNFALLLFSLCCFISETLLLFLFKKKLEWKEVYHFKKCVCRLTICLEL